MSEIIFIWRDVEIFKTRYKAKYELQYNDYCKKIRDSIKSKIPGIKYFNIDSIEINASQVDLIIAEDNIDTIVHLAKKATECELVNTVIICDDLSTLSKILTVQRMKPKLLTLDFMFKGIESVHLNIIKETLELYKKIKRQWEDVPVLGITNHTKDKKIDILLNEFQSNGDDYYNKTGIYEALPDVLRNRIEYFKIQHLKSKKLPTSDLPDLIANLNSLLIRNGVVLEAEKKAQKVSKLLELQEKVLGYVFKNEIKYKSTSLAGAMLYCETNPEEQLSKILFTHLNTTSKEKYKEYKLPEQPLAAVQKYFKAFDENGIITKEALIIVQLLKTRPDKWPISIEKAKQKSPASHTFVTFLDNIIVLL